MAFEPNPLMTRELKELESQLNKCGYRAMVFTDTGVGLTESTAKFQAFHSKSDEFARGGHMMQAQDGSEDSSANSTSLVRVIRLTDFILNVVNTRQLPSSRSPPRTILKMDVEGSELEVMSDLLVSGTLQWVDLTLIEWHERLETPDPDRARYLVGTRKAIETMAYLSSKLALSRHFEVLSFDDETYYNIQALSKQC